MKNKVWLVTGVSSGLGYSLIQNLLKHKFCVVAVTRCVESLENKLGYVEKENFMPLQVDITDSEAVSNAVQEVIAKYGKIDVLVNNAGYEQIGSIEDLLEEEIFRNFDVNFMGAFRFIKEVLPFMRANDKGHIINISSISNYSPWAGSGSYSISKSALDSLSKTLSSELAPWNVNVTSVLPGQFRTDFFDNVISLNSKRSEASAYKELYTKKMASIEKMNHKQLGDPQKFAQFLVELSELKKPPVYILVGEDAYKVANTSISDTMSNLQKWESISRDMGY